MKYHRCKKAELIVFAERRGIRVDSSHIDPGKGPSYRDYIKALKQADQDATFRLLDLSPELRTWVYEELLILRNSFTCFPQILSTCRQINSEATNILYGDNLIEVTIYRDGIYVHGTRCGPGDRSRLPSMFYPLYAWPQYLRKVQFLRLSMPVETWYWQGDLLITPNRRRLSFYTNIISHLAQFLAGNNCIRLCEIDIEDFPRATQEVDLWKKAIDVACHGDDQLDTIERCKILGRPIAGAETTVARIEGS